MQGAIARVTSITVWTFRKHRPITPVFVIEVLRPSHTAQNSRKRMNHAQISSLTWYISDLRISSVFLTWNLRSCAPMFAVSALYAIPGFEQLKTRLRVKVCAVLRCFTYFLRSLRSPYADNARNVRGISLIVCENVAAIAFVDDFPLTISRHMTHLSRLLHLSITENHWKKYIGVCIANRIRKQAHVIHMKYWWITDNSLITHVRLASYKSGYFNHLPSVQVLLPRGLQLYWKVFIVAFNRYIVLHLHILPMHRNKPNVT